jgi:hypothetical protein
MDIERKLPILGLVISVVSVPQPRVQIVHDYVGDKATTTLLPVGGFVWACTTSRTPSSSAKISFCAPHFPLRRNHAGSNNGFEPSL